MESANYKSQVGTFRSSLSVVRSLFVLQVPYRGLEGASEVFTGPDGPADDNKRASGDVESGQGGMETCILYLQNSTKTYLLSLSAVSKLSWVSTKTPPSALISASQKTKLDVASTHAKIV